MTDRLPTTSLRLGLPSGSMQNSTVDLFGRAGYRVSIQERSVFPRIDDERISAVLFRAQEMSRYVVDGIIDCGLTGYDWIVENGSENQIVEISELVYSRNIAAPAKWVLAVPDESDIREVKDFEGKVIATELVNVTRKYFAQRGVNVTVEFSWGTTEVKARLLDGIVDLTETGSSIRANNLRIIDTLLTSTIRFVANKDAWAIPWKREKMENIAMLLRGAIEARAKVGLKMNVPENQLAEVVSFLPAEKSPTVSRLSDPAWVAVEVILEEKQERELIPRLKRAGATGIITYPLNKVIPQASVVDELMDRLIGLPAKASRIYTIHMATTVEPTVLERLLEPLGVCLTPAVARRVVMLRADPQAQARVDELARKSNAGLLSPDELDEYRTYVSAGTFIAILQSKARALLAAKSRP